MDFSSHSCPVTNATADALDRLVSEIVAMAAAAVAAVIPGTISKGMPASHTGNNSSDSRAKIEGSPPLRRTTNRP